MEKDLAKEKEFNDTLDNTIKFLKEAGFNNENIYVDFISDNGIFRLYSADIDEDNVYQRIYGLTKEQKNNYDKEIKIGSINEVEAKYKSIIDVYFDRLRDESTKLEFRGNSFLDVIKILSECKKLGKNIYIEFKYNDYDLPVRFYSMDINVLEAFFKAMGVTHDEFKEHEKRLMNAKSDFELQLVISDLEDIIRKNNNIE